MVAPSYLYTGQVAPRFGDSGSLVEWKCCHNIMVEADIHLRPLHTSVFWVIGMLSQGHMVAPLYHYTCQVAPRFGDSDLFEEWKWCHNVMIEADIHLRPLHTSILGIYNVFEPLVCCLKGIWLHPYTITPAKLAPDLGIQGHMRSWNYAIMSCLRLISTSDCFIHPY